MSWKYQIVPLFPWPCADFVKFWILARYAKFLNREQNSEKKWNSGTYGKSEKHSASRWYEYQCGVYNE